MLNDHVGNVVRTFYDEVGWETEGGITEDAKRFEDLRECASDYVSKCRLRVLRHIPSRGANMLEVASGPIQFREYLDYSKNFEKRYCVDLSARALDAARKKIGDHGVFLHGDFLELPLDENFFDCSISLHTIYHIDKDAQEEAVRKLIRVTKPGQPVVIVYSNPNTLIRRLSWPFLMARKIQRQLRALMHTNSAETGHELYFHPHPLEWWNRFNDVASIRIVPWRSFASKHQSMLIPNSGLGKRMFDHLFALEEKFPRFFAKHFQYPMIIMTKHLN